MKKMVLFLVLAVGLVFSNVVFAAPNITTLLNSVDSLDDLKNDLTSKFVMTQQRTGEGVKITEGIYYRRDSDKSFMILMTAPEVEKGNGYLKMGENFWMYKRNTRTFQHVNRDESIGGTDVSTEDMENKKLIEMYKPALDSAGKEKLSETKLGDIPVYQFEVNAKIENVQYPKRIYWIRQDNFLPLKIQGFSQSGTLMITDYYLKYTQIGGKYLFMKGMFVDEFEKGNKTLLEVQSIALKKIDDHVFTKAYLESLSK